MLVLKRLQDQSIVIDDNIIITLLEVHSGAAKIGFEAPRDIAVHRQEIRRKNLKKRDLKKRSVSCPR